MKTEEMKAEDKEPKNLGSPIYMDRHLSVYKNGEIYLIRCPKCERENWALAVAGGACAWCGYDANQSEGLRELIESIKTKQKKLSNNEERDL